MRVGNTLPPLFLVALVFGCDRMEVPTQPVNDGDAATLLASSGTAFSSTSNVALGATVTLQGGEFFTGGWGGGMTVNPSTVVDGVFFAKDHQWDQGPVWWDSDQDGVPRSVRVDLGARCLLESFIAQVDDNDAYLLSFWNLDTSAWDTAWHIPNFDAVGWGMQTRPNAYDDTERQELTSPIVTTALKLELEPVTDGLGALSELQAFGVCFEIDVDIKPGSCPNPVQTRARGVLPVAILGTAAFDVAQIDPASVALEGVPPLRWSMEDVSTPYPSIPLEPYDCTEAGPDGFLDLSLKFAYPEVMAAIGDVQAGDVLALSLTADLLDGSSVAGVDVMLVVQ